MTSLQRLCLAAAAALCVTTLPALAASNAASSAASSASTSLTTSAGSLSNSLQGSSGSSGNATQVAEGPHRVIEMAAVAERPGEVRLKLQAVAGPQATGGDFYLFVPQAVADGTTLAVGSTVTARHRPYGLEFAEGAEGAAPKAFFLALADDWLAELQTRPVPL